MIISTYLPIQERIEYALEYTSISHLQKHYQFHLANSTKHDFLGLQRLDLAGMYFYSS